MLRRPPTPVLRSAHQHSFSFFSKPVVQIEPHSTIHRRITAAAGFKPNSAPHRLFSTASEHEHKHFYDLLGIKPGVSQAEIKNAFRRMAKKYHPDVAGGNHKKFIDIHFAYRVLSGAETGRNQSHSDAQAADDQQERDNQNEMRSRHRREAEEKLNNLMREAMWGGLKIPLLLLSIGVILVIATMYDNYRIEEEKNREEQRRRKEEARLENERQLRYEQMREEEKKFYEQHPEVQREYERARRCHGYGIALGRTCF